MDKEGGPPPRPARLAQQISRAAGAWAGRRCVLVGLGPPEDPEALAEALDLWSLTRGLRLPEAAGLALVLDEPAPGGLPARDVWAETRLPEERSAAWSFLPASSARPLQRRRRADDLVAACLRHAMGCPPPPPRPWGPWLGSLWLHMAAELVEASAGSPPPAAEVVVASHPLVALADHIAADRFAPRPGKPPRPFDWDMADWLGARDWPWLVRVDQAVAEPLLDPAWCAWAGMEVASLGYELVIEPPNASSRRLLEAGRPDVDKAIRKAATAAGWLPGPRRLRAAQ